MADMLPKTEMPAGWRSSPRLHRIAEPEVEDRAVNIPEVQLTVAELRAQDPEWLYKVLGRRATLTTQLKLGEQSAEIRALYIENPGHNPMADQD